MKNIQVIDGADNCTYDIFQASDSAFATIFPRGRDIEFIEDLIKRIGPRRASLLLGRLWKRPLNKRLANGIHGTIFYELKHKKGRFYKTKKEAEMMPGSRGFDYAQAVPGHRHKKR